jgi:hypothetical protein
MNQSRVSLNPPTAPLWGRGSRSAVGVGKVKIGGVVELEAGLLAAVVGDAPFELEAVLPVHVGDRLHQAQVGAAVNQAMGCDKAVGIAGRPAPHGAFVPQGHVLRDLRPHGDQGAVDRGQR